MYVGNRDIVEILVRFVVFKDEVQLVGCVNLTRDAVNTTRGHIAGLGVVVDLVAAVCVKVFYDIYNAFLVFKYAYDCGVVGAEIKHNMNSCLSV